MIFHLHVDRLHEFAPVFWQQVNGANVFAFHGEMGAGKTTIIEYLCKQKGVKQTMGSPTFSIINQYVYDEDGVEKSVYHIDLYRLKDEEEVLQAGVEDCVYSGQLCFVEWPEKAPQLFDDAAVHVHLQVVSETERTVKIVRPSAV